MKILGFHFSSKPNMASQVDSIRKKFRARLWMPRHLRHRGFNTQELVCVFKSIILPVHDNCSTVYNASLTRSQEAQLERLQAQGLKSIFGYDKSYAELLIKSGLTTLKIPRDARALAFAQKCCRGRFSSWFPLNFTSRTL